MTVRGAEALWLDYGEAAANPKLLQNLSTVASAGRYLWTASDELRTIECLEATEDGYRLTRQVALDTVFKGIPGLEDEAEADIESIDIWQGRLWVSGSHCRVRQKTEEADLLDSRVRQRPSRRLMGVVDLKGQGGNVAGTGAALPFKGDRSLRGLLRRNDYLKRFMSLPSKENGLDIEGLSVWHGELMFGLRGPLLDSFAVVIQAPVKKGLPDGREPFTTHFLDLGGLGVRDLARWERHLLILAGPVSEADGPFKLFKWAPRKSKRVQKPEPVPEVEFMQNKSERPEGICRLDRNGTAGLLVLSDSRDTTRIEGSRFRADWIPMQKTARAVEGSQPVSLESVRIAS